MEILINFFFELDVKRLSIQNRNQLYCVSELISRAALRRSKKEKNRYEYFGSNKEGFVDEGKEKLGLNENKAILE